MFVITAFIRQRFDDHDVIHVFTDEPVHLWLAGTRIPPSRRPHVVELRGQPSTRGYDFIWSDLNCIDQQQPGFTTVHTFVLNFVTGLPNYNFFITEDCFAPEGKQQSPPFLGVQPVGLPPLFGVDVYNPVQVTGPPSSVTTLPWQNEEWDIGGLWPCPGDTQICVPAGGRWILLWRLFVRATFGPATFHMELHQDGVGRLLLSEAMTTPELGDTRHWWVARIDLLNTNPITLRVNNLGPGNLQVRNTGAGVGRTEAAWVLQ